MRVTKHIQAHNTSAHFPSDASLGSYACTPVTALKSRSNVAVMPFGINSLENFPPSEEPTVVWHMRVPKPT